MQFNCQNCGARYQVVRVEAESVKTDRQLECLRPVRRCQTQPRNRTWSSTSVVIAGRIGIVIGTGTAFGTDPHSRKSKVRPATDKPQRPV